MKEIIVQPMSIPMGLIFTSRLRWEELGTIAWYDPAVGGFYISERTIPDNIKNTGRLIELVRKQK